MNNTQLQIAANLERQFSEMGFSTHGVEALRVGANVSFRTLCKYAPGREAMVIGALNYRDVAYSGGSVTAKPKAQITCCTSLCARLTGAGQSIIAALHRAGALLPFPAYDAAHATGARAALKSTCGATAPAY